MRLGYGIGLPRTSPDSKWKWLSTVNANPYPVVANSLLWIDRFRSATDTSGLVLAGDGDSVRTISLPASWGASLGDGLVRQETSGNRPTYKTNGLQGNATSTIMSLPATVSLSGTFTVYAVIDFNGSYNQPITTIAGNGGSFGGAIANFNAAGMRTFDDSAVYLQSLSVAPTGLVMARVRRNAGNNLFFAITGTSDTAKSATDFAWPLNRILSYPGVFNNTSARVRQIVVVGADTVTAGTDAVIQAALIALETGLTGIS